MSIEIIKYSKAIILIQLALTGGCTTASSHPVDVEVEPPKNVQKIIPENTPPGTIPNSFMIGKERYREQFMNDPAARTGNNKFISMTTTHSHDGEPDYYGKQIFTRYGNFIKNRNIDSWGSPKPTSTEISDWIVLYNGIIELEAYPEHIITVYEFKIDFYNGKSFADGAPEKYGTYDHTEYEDMVGAKKFVSTGIRTCTQGKELLASKYISGLPGKIYIYDCTDKNSYTGNSFEKSRTFAYSDYLNINIPNGYIPGDKAEDYPPLGGTITFKNELGETKTADLKPTVMK